MASGAAAVVGMDGEVISNKDQKGVENNRPKRKAALSLHDDRDLEGQIKDHMLKVRFLIYDRSLTNVLHSVFDEVFGRVPRMRYILHVYITVMVQIASCLINVATYPVGIGASLIEALKVET